MMPEIELVPEGSRGGLLDEPEGAYLDVLLSLPPKKQLAEIRRAYTLWLVLQHYGPVEDATKLAHDMEGFLKDSLRGASEIRAIQGGKT